MQLVILLRMLPYETVRAFVSKINSQLHRRPSSAPFISGDTFRAIAHNRFDSTQSCTPQDIKPGSIVFVSSERLEEFANTVLAHVKHPLVLLSGQGDRNIGNSFTELAGHPLIKHWYAQNCMLVHPKVTPLPIGLEDRWRFNHGNYSGMRRVLGNRPGRPAIAYGFTIGNNIEKRIPCYVALRRTPAAIELPGYFNSSEYRRLVRRFMFIASPPGNGLDCHRTWEAMYMNCIPIVEKNYMNEYFASLGLHMVLVEDWQEIVSWTESSIQELYQRIMGQCTREPLFLDYWVKKININAGAAKT